MIRKAPNAPNAPNRIYGALIPETSVRATTAARAPAIGAYPNNESMPRLSGPRVMPRVGDLAQQSFDALFDAVSADRPPPTQPATSGLTLEELTDEFARQRRGRGVEKKTQTDYELLFEALKELLGPDKVVTEIDRADCRRTKELFEKLPANARKRFPAMTLPSHRRRGRCRDAGSSVPDHRTG